VNSFKTDLTDYETTVSTVNVEVDADLTNLRTEIAARLVAIDAEQVDEAARLVEIDDTLGVDQENLLPVLFGWITLRVNRKNGFLTSAIRAQDAIDEAGNEASALGPVADTL